MDINFRIMPEWPCLSWVATVYKEKRTMIVHHGPKVEISKHWFVEGVWNDDFDRGSFYNADCFFGSGGYLHEEEAIFSGSRSNMDRLLFVDTTEILYVSNSMPAILSVSKLELDGEYEEYQKNVNSIVKSTNDTEGFLKVKSRFDEHQLKIVFNSNIVFGKDGIVIVRSKTAEKITFRDFLEYKNYMNTAMDQLSANARSLKRRYPIQMLSTVSSGYDSSACAVLAAKCGCQEALTIDKANSFWRGSDSGSFIAKKLGMDCATYPRNGYDARFEASIWASSGRPGELNWTQFVFPQPLCALFTGFHGDYVWRNAGADGVGDAFSRPDLAGYGLTEFRLLAGVIHCPVPYIGIDGIESIYKISSSSEMLPWSVGGKYDRPIARRLVEDEGVPRELFGVRKKDTSSEAGYIFPYSKVAVSSFRNYLSQRGVKAPSDMVIFLLRKMCLVETLFYKNVIKPFGIRRSRKIISSSVYEKHIFQWANHEMKKLYKVVQDNEFN